MTYALSPLLKIRFSILIGTILLCLSQIAYSTDSSQSTNPYFIDGYDVVTYHYANGPLKGNTAFTTQYKSHTLLFSSEETRAEFINNPEFYMPAYNGYCAYGMVYGMKSKVDPLQYDIVDGQLFLQLDRGTKRRWNRRMSRNIKKGNRAWKKLATSADGG